jgi:hypothetical protein
MISKEDTFAFSYLPRKGLAIATKKKTLLFEIHAVIQKETWSVRGGKSNAHVLPSCILSGILVSVFQHRCENPLPSLTAKLRLGPLFVHLGARGSIAEREKQTNREATGTPEWVTGDGAVLAKVLELGLRMAARGIS